MLFSSPAFLVFFALYYAVHRFLQNPAYRLWLIVLGGTIFYMWWNPVYVILPYGLTALSFLGAFWIATGFATGGRLRIGVVITLLLLPLLVFKYTDFFYGQVFGPMFNVDGKILGLPLPLGISFITFTLIAYVVDIWRRQYPVERRLPMLAGYVLFFPHLIAGPILRPHELLPQLAERRGLNPRVGIVIFTVGLAKKLVIADQIAVAIDPIFRNPAVYDALYNWLAIYGFTIQIYCDFSGYTDMAIGLAILLGVRLPNNFRQPYRARSIVDFWRRWHITLSHWLRDYLYIPLGGNRHGRWRQALAVFVTMALDGLWHGANWTFLLWGIFHGTAVAVTHAVRRYFSWIPAWLAILLTFHFVAFNWVLFRAPNVSTAGNMFQNAMMGGMGDLGDFVAKNSFVLLLIAVALVIHRWDDHRRYRAMVRYWPSRLLWPAIGLLWLLSFTMSAGGSAAFIYFDF